MLGPWEPHRAPDAELHLARPNPESASHVLGAVRRDRDDRRSGLERQASDASSWSTERAGPNAGALGKDANSSAAVEHDARRLHGDLVGLPAADGERADAGENPPLPAALEELDLGDVLHRPPPREGRPDHEGVEEAAVVGGDDQPALDAPEVLAAGPREAEPDQERRLEDHACDEVDQPVDAAAAGVVVVAPEPRLADHAVGAWRRRLPRALVHAHAYTHTHVPLLTRRRGCVPTERAFSYQPSSTRRRSSARPGGSGVFASSGRSSIA